MWMFWVVRAESLSNRVTLPLWMHGGDGYVGARNSSMYTVMGAFLSDEFSSFYFTLTPT